jgi:hypothetical protein
VRKSNPYRVAYGIFLFCAATAMTSPAQTFSSLASFAKTDGSAPISVLSFKARTEACTAPQSTAAPGTAAPSSASPPTVR